jgi:arylsulfatase A-like enzyme
VHLVTSNRTGGWLLISAAVLLALAGCGGAEPEQLGGSLDLLPLAAWNVVPGDPPPPIRLPVAEGSPLLGPGWQADATGDHGAPAVVSSQRHAALHLPFSVDGHGEVEILLRLRNPWPNKEIDSFLGTIVSFNGRKMAHLIPGDEWADHRVTLPAGQFRDGVNELVLTGLEGRTALSRVDLLLPGPLARFTAGDTTSRALVSAAPLVVDLPEPLPAGSLLDFSLALVPQLTGPVICRLEWRHPGGEWGSLFEMEAAASGSGTAPERHGRWIHQTVSLDQLAGEKIRLRFSVDGPQQVCGPLSLSWPGTDSAAMDTSPAGPNLVLILADTLRADRLGAGGSAQRLTPSLDALAAESVHFRDTLAQASSTVPSVSSFFTGRYFNRITHWVDRKSLPATVPLFAEALSAGGCRTLAVMTNPLLLPETGFARGFDEYHHLPGAPRHFHGRENLPVHQPAEAVNARFFQRLPSLDRGRFFAYLHYMDPHDPYMLEQELQDDPRFSGGRLNGEPWEGWLGPAVEEILAHGGSTVVPRDREMLAHAYDNEVRRLDRQLGLLLAELRRRGLLSNTVVAVVADHGEEFFEHGLLGHGHTVYEELLRVPALVRFPRQPGYPRPALVGQRVELLDIAATLLDVMVAGPPEGHAGSSLLPLLRGMGGEPGDEVRHFETRHRAWVNPPLNDFLAGVEAGGWKLTRDRRSGVERLYHLNTDPGEMEDLAAANPDKAGEMKQRLDAWLETQAPLNPEDGDARDAGEDVARREIEALKALGYMQ